jgi:hypothetical protein
MGIQAPIPTSTKLGDFNNVSKRIVAAAEHPHLSPPQQSKAVKYLLVSNFETC